MGDLQRRGGDTQRSLSLPTSTQRKDHVKAEKEGSHLKVKKRGLIVNQPLDFKPPTM